MSDALIAFVVSCLILVLMAAWVPFLHGCHHVTGKLRQRVPAENPVEAGVLFGRRSRAL